MGHETFNPLTFRRELILAKTRRELTLADQSRPVDPDADDAREREILLLTCIITAADLATGASDWKDDSKPLPEGWRVRTTKDPDYEQVFNEHGALVGEREILRHDLPDAPGNGPGTLFDNVIAVLQNAEEAGGPEGKEYLDLMNQVADECLRRRDAYAKSLEWKATASRNAIARITVHMRAPMKGERGWYVKANDADAALAEVLAESEELGFIAGFDHDDARDIHGMRPVTIEISAAETTP